MPSPLPCITEPALNRDADIEDEPTIIYSPLRQRIESDDIYVDVEICHGEDDDEPGWLLEVADEDRGSTAYDQRFSHDKDALDEVMATIRKHGIRAYIEGRLDDGEEMYGSVQ